MQITLERPYLIVKPGFSEEEFYRLANEDTDWEYLDGRIVIAFTGFGPPREHFQLPADAPPRFPG
jgi:hypothetical protein